VLLVTASIVMVILVWSQYGFFGDFLTAVVGDPKVQARVAQILGDAAKNMTPEELGQRFLEPGLLFKAPIDQISLGMALVFGTAGMPHILMRFFTVPTAQEARKSVVWAMAIIGGFYVLTLFLGMGAAMKVGPDAIRAIDPGGNMANPLLAQALGGGPDSLLGNFMLAFVSAVAFATIVAVVAGLVLAIMPRRPSRCAPPRSPPSSSAAWPSPSASPPRGRTSLTWWRWPLRWRPRPTSPASS